MNIKEENQLLRSTLSTFVDALSMFIVADGKLRDLNRAELVEVAKDNGVYVEPDLNKNTLEEICRVELRVKLWELVQGVRQQLEILEK